MKMKRLQLIQQSIILTLLVSGVASAETCFPPVRPFLPSDRNAVAQFFDLIAKDFETYIGDMQVYFQCLESERARAFEEARHVSQDYKRFLNQRSALGP